GTAARCRIVRLADTGEQEKTSVVEGPGCEKDERRRLEDLFTRGINVGNAASGRFRIGVKEYAANPSAGSERDALAFSNNRQQEIRRLRLSSDHATEPGAEAAISAATARDAVRVGVRLADVGRRRRIGMVAEKLGSISE